MSWPIDEFYILQHKDPRAMKWYTILRDNDLSNIKEHYRRAVVRESRQDIRTARAFTYKDQNDDIQIKEIEILDYRKGRDDTY